MVNESRNARGTTPPPAGRTPHAELESGRANLTPADARVERAIDFKEYDFDDQGEEEVEDDEESDDEVTLKDVAEKRLIR